MFMRTKNARAKGLTLRQHRGEAATTTAPARTFRIAEIAPSVASADEHIPAARRTGPL